MYAHLFECFFVGLVRIKSLHPLRIWASTCDKMTTYQVMNNINIEEKVSPWLVYGNYQLLLMALAALLIYIFWILKCNSSLSTQIPEIWLHQGSKPLLMTSSCLQPNSPYDSCIISVMSVCYTVFLQAALHIYYMPHPLINQAPGCNFSHLIGWHEMECALELYRPAGRKPLVDYMYVEIGTNSFVCSWNYYISNSL